MISLLFEAMFFGDIPAGDPPAVLRFQRTTRFVVLQDRLAELHEAITSSMGVGVGHAACDLSPGVKAQVCDFMSCFLHQEK
jgi:hypothetical protein